MISPLRNVSVQVHLGYSSLYIPGRGSTKRGWHYAHEFFKLSEIV